MGRKVVKVLSLFVILLFAVVSLHAKVVKKCDSFIFVADESSSMNNSYNDMKKVDFEKKLLNLINQNIPEIEYEAALIAFGSKKSEEDLKSTILYPVGSYDKNKMSSAINNIEGTISWTPLGFALDKTGEVVAKLKGKVHIILFSDGQENSNYKSPVQAAKELKKNYDNVCLYVVQIGDSDEGGELLGKMVDAVGCGKVYSGDSLQEEDGLNGFIQEVFGYVEVEKDDDHDGVLNKYDECPNTPKGAPVNDKGCWEIGKVFFDYNKAVIKPSAIPVLKEILEVLKQNPEIKLEIKGYTDALGTDPYNMKLSKKRAEAVFQYFVKNGISAERLIIKFFGKNNPIAPNTDEKGRALNRRVEFTIIR